MEDKLHPLTELMIARAKSHPEEFTVVNSYANRWREALATIERHGTIADASALKEVIGRINMDHMHEWALEELMNGEERRAEEKRRQEEEARVYLQQAALQGGYANTTPNGYTHRVMNTTAADNRLGLSQLGQVIGAGLKNPFGK